MRTIWKLFDVMKFQEEIKVAQKPLWSHNTSEKVSTNDPDENSQQGPEHTEARPRADRSSIAGCNDANLEQTAAQSPGTMLQISSRKLERENESRKLHQTEAKPADREVQRQVNNDESAFSRKTVHGNEQRGNLIQDGTEKFKRGSLPRACQRKTQESSAHVKGCGV